MKTITSVDALVRESVHSYPDKTILISAEDDARQLTYTELDAQVSQAAHALQQLGIRQGDVVSLFLKNSLDFFPPWLGTIRLGGIVNPINLGLEKNVERVSYMLKKARAKAFILEAEFSELAQAIKKELPQLPIIIINQVAHSDIDWEKELSQADTSFPGVPVRAEDPFQMIFTSGTTGLPKAVVQRHEMVSDAFALADHFKFTTNEVMMCVLPLFHVNAQYTSFFPALGLGSTLILFEKFSASRFFSTIQKQNVNYVSVVPSLLTRLLSHGISITSKDCSSLRFIICGAAPLSVELQKKFMDLTGIPIPNGWGMTETGCWGCHNDPDNIVLGSIGKALSINEMKIVDPNTGNDLPSHETGSLLIRGNNIFQEYFDAEEATQQAFRFGDEWFDTGDDAYQDENGYFFFVGRGSVDTGKVDGEFVNFLTLDEKLWEHPDIQEVCCVGVPDPIRGEVVAACVVKNKDSEISEEEIISFCKDAHFASYEMPRYVLFVEDIPKGDTGKLQRRVMTERAIVSLNLPTT